VFFISVLSVKTEALDSAAVAWSIVSPTERANRVGTEGLDCLPVCLLSSCTEGDQMIMYAIDHVAVIVAQIQGSVRHRRGEEAAARLLLFGSEVTLPARRSPLRSRRA